MHVLVILLFNKSIPLISLKTELSLKNKCFSVDVPTMPAQD